MTKHNKKNIYIVILLTLFAFFSFYIYKNIDLLIDSDMSSELVLSQILAKEKNLLTDSWFYSTELRVFNTQYIFAPLFLLTNNYHIVRIVGSLVIDILLLISFIYACKALDIKCIPFLSFFVLGCFTKDYFDFYIKAPHYVPYLLVCFVTIGLVFKDEKNSILKYTLVFIISVISSMNGIRQLTAIYLPLVCVSILELVESLFMRKKIEFGKPLYMLTYVGFIGSVIGYLLNSKILSVKYNIQADQWKLVLAFPSINKIKDILYGWLSSFGYTNAISPVYSYITLAISVLSAIGLLLISIRIMTDEKFSKKDKYILKFVIISIVEMSCVFLLTDMTVITRYFSLNAIMCILVLGIYISRTESSKVVNRAICCVFVGFIVINSFVVTNTEIINSNNGSLIKIKDVLLEENCVNGYASFWDANIITEMSDGVIEVWMYRIPREEFPSDIYELSNGEWLQKKEHFLKKPEGKVFVIVDSDCDSLYNKQLQNYTKYSDRSNKLLIFNDYNEMKEVLN